MKRLNGRMDCPKCSRVARRIWLISGGFCDSCLVHTFSLQEILKNSEARLHRELRNIYRNQKQTEKPKMVTCPECFEEFPETDLRAQIKHMENHPQVIVWELERLGYHQAADRVLREKSQRLGKKI